MRYTDLSGVQAKTGGDYADLPAGGYLCRIMDVADVPEKEYLKVFLDIAAGEYKDYYSQLEERAGFWGCIMYWSYKEANLGYFKGNIEAVQQSDRQGWTFDGKDEKSLVGRMVGAVFGEEEYKAKTGEIKCNVKPRFLVPTQKILDGDYSIPKRKAYDPAKDRNSSRPAEGFQDIFDDGPLPWDE